MINGKNITGLIRSADTIFWWGYLGLIVWASTIFDMYRSSSWVLFSQCVYIFAAAYCFTVVLGGSCNFRALHRSRIALAVLAASILWLLLQQILPFRSHLGNSVFGTLPMPDWFNVAASMSVTPQRTWWLMMSQVMIATLFLLSLCLVDRRARVKQLLFVICLVGITQASVGIFAKYAGIHLVDKISLDGHFFAARGWFVNRNHFGAFVSLSLIGAATYLLKDLMQTRDVHFLRVLIDQIASVRVFFLLALLIGLAAISLSESRGAFLALLASSLLTFTLMNKADTKVVSRRRVLLPILLLFTVSMLYFGQGMLERFSANSISIGERGAQWAITWQAIKHEFLFGYGGGSYALVFQTFREYADLRQVVYDQSHNDYLHIWLEQGFIGLALWITFVLIALYSAIRGISNSSSTLVRAALLCIVVVIVAALTQSLVDYNLQIMNIRSYFFVIIALSFSLPCVVHRSR